MDAAEQAAWALVRRLFYWEEDTRLWRFIGGRDQDGSSRVSHELMKDLVYQAASEDNLPHGEKP